MVGDDGGLSNGCDAMEWSSAGASSSRCFCCRWLLSVFSDLYNFGQKLHFLVLFDLGIVAGCEFQKLSSSEMKYVCMYFCSQS